MSKEEIEKKALELYPMQTDSRGDYIYAERRRAYLKSYKQAMLDFRICDCGKQVRSEEEFKLFLGCSGCASTLD